MKRRRGWGILGTGKITWIIAGALASMRTLDKWRHSAGLDYQITEHPPRPSGTPAEGP